VASPALPTFLLASTRLVLIHLKIAHHEIIVRCNATTAKESSGYVQVRFTSEQGRGYETEVGGLP